MSFFGVPPEISALQASQAQREAAKTRDRERAVRDQGRGSEEAERLFRVNEAEDVAEIHPYEESRDKHDRSRRRRTVDPNPKDVSKDDLGDDESSRLDVTA